MKRHIILIGFMGTGKSTISKELSLQTGWKELDLDAYIEQEKACAITEIFEKEGEEAFRDYESMYLRKVLEMPDGILSCGGGTVLRSQNVENMKENGTIVLLTATPQTVYERVKDSTNRPILNGHMNPEYIAGLMEKRREVYEKSADVVIATDGKNPEDIAKEILEKVAFGK